MKCTKCGKEFERTFCPECGTQAAPQALCPVCGKERTAEKQFCPNCGHSFAAEAAAPQPAKERMRFPKKPALLLPISSAPIIICGGAVFFALLFFFLSISPLVSADLPALILGMLGCMALTAVFAIFCNSYTLGIIKARAYEFDLRGKRKPDVTVKPQKYLRRQLICFGIFAVLGLTASLLSYLLLSHYSPIYLTPFGTCLGFVVVLGAPLAASIWQCVWWKRHKNAIYDAYYETAEDGSRVCTATYAKLSEAIYRLCADRVNFWCDLFRRDPVPDEISMKHIGYASFCKRRLAFALCFFAFVGIALECWFVTYDHIRHNIFHIGKVDHVSLGDSMSDVDRLLPDPYDKDKDTHTWTYYDDNYIKLLEKNDDFDPSGIQDWNDFESAFNDAADLERTEFGYIEVRFAPTEENSNYYLVESILFDPACTYRDRYKARKTTSFEVLDIDLDEETPGLTVSYAAIYEHGSYYKARAAARIDEASSETAVLVWNDPFGNEYEAEYSLPA